MKKILASLILTSLLILPVIGFAAVEPGTEPGGGGGGGHYVPPYVPPQGGGGGGTVVNAAPNLDVMEVLERIANWLFAILLVIAVIYLIIGSYNFVTAAGDANKIKAGKDSIMWALAGVMVAFLAKGLVNLVKRIIVGP